MGNKRLERMDMREVDLTPLSEEQFEILEGKVKERCERKTQALTPLEKAFLDYEQMSHPNQEAYYAKTFKEMITEHGLFFTKEGQTDEALDQQFADNQVRPMAPYLYGNYMGQYSMDTNKPEGRGKYVDNSGTIYEGYWLNGMRHGPGRAIEGTMRSEGTWVEGWLEGPKCRRAYPGVDYYEGEMVRGKNHGKGVYHWGNGEKYDGDFDKDYINGQGTWSFQNGDTYVGEVMKGCQHGQGVMTYENGKKYDGEWKLNSKDGQGTETMPNGDTFVGTWEKDKKEGEFTVTENGETKTAMYSNDVRTEAEE